MTAPADAISTSPADPYLGRDTRTRLANDMPNFATVETTTRRILLLIGIVALCIGLAPVLVGGDHAAQTSRASLLSLQLPNR